MKVGIKPEVLKTGHSVFYTKQGHRPGLVVCYWIARHNAVIDVKSEPGNTTFFVSSDCRQTLQMSLIEQEIVEAGHDIEVPRDIVVIWGKEMIREMRARMNY